MVIERKITPAICIELNKIKEINKKKLFYELTEIAQQFPQTQGINLFYIHQGFPMDVRHNAKIFREKLSTWAQANI